MGRKATHRIIRDPMAWINKAMPLAGDQQRDIGIAYRASLQAMLRGYGTEQTWSTVSCALNIALILAEEGVLPHAMGTIKESQEALLRSHTRAAKFKTWAFDGSGIKATLAATNLHDEQLKIATRSQVIKALNEVKRRVAIGETL